MTIKKEKKKPCRQHVSMVAPSKLGHQGHGRLAAIGEAVQVHARASRRRHCAPVESPAYLWVGWQRTVLKRRTERGDMTDTVVTETEKVRHRQNRDLDTNMHTYHTS